MKIVIVSLALLCVFCWASCEPVPKGETIMDVAAKALQMLKDLCDEGKCNYWDIILRYCYIWFYFQGSPIRGSKNL